MMADFNCAKIDRCYGNSAKIKDLLERIVDIFVLVDKFYRRGSFPSAIFMLYWQ